MQQWVNDQLEEWKKEQKSPGRPLDEYGKIYIASYINLCNTLNFCYVRKSVLVDKLFI